MKLTTKQDIAAPADQIFALLSDHETWERAAIRKGAEVERLDTLTGMAAGMEWRATFAFRGRRREAKVQLTRYEPTSHMGFAVETPLYAGTMGLDVFQMSARRSRIHVVIEVKPKTLAARLMLQSLRLARGRVERRLDRRVAQFAAEVESRLRVAQG